MSRRADGGRPTPGDRGQLVLVAAGVVAVALLLVLVAYLQFGYAEDVHASEDYAAPAEDARRVLERAVYRAGVGLPGNYSWDRRRAAVRAVRDRLAPGLERLERARVEAGTVYQVEYADDLARSWARRRCPGGPDRQFGPCVADGGVVVQRRAGEVHLLAVAFEVTVTTERGTTRLTTVVRAVPDAGG